MIGAIIGGFTILGAFLTLTAWINGRTIKKYIGELIERESRATRELMMGIKEMVNKLSDQHERMIKQHEEMMTQMIKQYEATVTQHETMIKILQGITAK